ncbi:DUF2207 domain-containing protein [Patescibacteria group bacterium]|nr:DUF2207 domain-containing protein [Patescibacteria group bacterium]
MRKTYFFAFLILASFIFSASSIEAARDPYHITDWYIDQFETSIVVNKDSSLLITENITADCGNLPNKHGIFRVLPTEIRTEKGVFKTPIELISIADFNGNPYKYQTIKDKTNKTITWKIGDANKTVKGLNYYRIVYEVKNAVRFNNPNFDELYWNLLGTFWQIDINNFSAELIFPSEVNQQKVQIDYYTGFLGEKSKDLAVYSWGVDNSLSFFSTASLISGQGITASISFPKGIFTPYEPTFWEKYGGYFGYLYLLIPILIFVYAFKKWRRYGDDPKMKRPIPPEFEIPEKITPIQMGMVISSGRWNDKLITATLIDLAVKRVITIEQVQEKVLFFKIKDFKLIKNNENYEKSNLGPTEIILLDKLFKGQDTVHLSALKRKFYKDIPSIKKVALKDVKEQGWIEEKGLSLSSTFITLGFVVIISAFFTASFSAKLFLSCLLSGIILIIFGAIMPKRTQKGTDLIFRIKGMERYMKTAEKYRQQFYEKENIFDKLLPYAIVFGIASLWAKKMEQIYGKEYFANYHPVWLVGASYASFNTNSFISELNSITNSIASNTSTSSGAHGSGGAGGGGGGGGGGGW